MPNEKGFLRPTRVPYKVLYSLLFTLILVIIVLLLPSGLSSTGKNSRALLDNKSALVKGDYSLFEFNRTYPLTSPTSKFSSYRGPFLDHRAGYARLDCL